MKKLNTILLIDDYPADNRYHQLLLQEMNIADNIIIIENGQDALKYLKQENQILPELIFLDIGMPKMNGWEFLDEYRKLDKAIRSKMKVIILTISSNPADINKIPGIDEVTNFEFKPLTKRVITEILKRYFGFD